MDIIDMEELSTKTQNTLRRAGITTVEELQKRLSENPEGLLKIRWVGPATIEEIRRALHLSEAGWLEGEISTRNCFNAKVHKGLVRCIAGRELLRPYDEVAHSTKLYPSCEGCTNFDNNWA